MKENKKEKKYRVYKRRNVTLHDLDMVTTYSIHTHSIPLDYEDLEWDQLTKEQQSQFLSKDNQSTQQDKNKD